MADTPLCLGFVYMEHGTYKHNKAFRSLLTLMLLVPFSIIANIISLCSLYV